MFFTDCIEELFYPHSLLPTFVILFLFLELISDSILLRFLTLSSTPHNFLARLSSVKKSCADVASLRDYFDFSFGAPYSVMHQKAVQNFVKSLVGYSLITYLLQVSMCTAIYLSICPSIPLCEAMNTSTSSSILNYAMPS